MGLGGVEVGMRLASTGQRFSAWSPVGGPVREGLGGVVLLADVYC